MRSPIAGQAYFITNDEPRKFWGFFGDLLEPLGYGRPHIALPWLPLFLIAWLNENLILPILNLFYEAKPSDFSTVRLTIAASNRTISCGRAKKDLGYRPRIPMHEAIQRTVAHFQPLKNSQESRKGV